MVKHETEHLAMADLLWSTLLKMNMADPNVTGDHALSKYYSDNSHLAREEKVWALTPYAHVQEALKYALLNLTDGDEKRARQLRYLLADNCESVSYNLAVLREQEQYEADDRLEKLIDGMES